MAKKTISEGSKLEIIDEINSESKHTYYSVVTNILDSNFFEMQAPLEKGIVIPLEIGKEYECLFITTYGLYRCKVILENRRREAGLHFLVMKVTSSIKKYQRRGFFRLDAVLNFRYYNKDTDQWNDAVTLDISGNGVRCICDENLSKGSHVNCKFVLNISKKEYIVTCEAEVIDTKPFNSQDKRFETRWVFIDIPSSKQDIIIRYIYDEQRRKIKIEGR